MTTPTPRTLQEVLRGGRQCDEDGVEIIMSREACCVAADTIDRLERELSAAQEARQRAEALAESYRKDAERYRWLRIQPHADIAACWYMPVMPQDYPVDTPEQRDAAIDAAIAARKP